MKQKIVVGIVIVCALTLMALSIVAATNPYGSRDLNDPLHNNVVISRWYNPTYGYLPDDNGAYPFPYPYWNYPQPTVMPL
jgi:hypothetical protein